MDPEDDSTEPGPDAGASPTVFGLDARPWSCGCVGALLFGALMAPVMLFGFGVESWTCLPDGYTCWENEQIGMAKAGLIAVALVAGLYGLAAGRLVRIWPFRRPPLWAALVGLTLLATSVGSVLVWLLAAALGGLM